MSNGSRRRERIGKRERRGRNRKRREKEKKQQQQQLVSSWRSAETQPHLRVKALWRRSLAAAVVYSKRRVRADVRVEALGVAHVLEDPGAQVGEAAVLGQHQPGPGVALHHVQGRDGHGAPHLGDTWWQ